MIKIGPQGFKVWSFSSMSGTNVVLSYIRYVTNNLLTTYVSYPECEITTKRKMFYGRCMSCILIVWDIQTKTRQVAPAYFEKYTIKVSVYVKIFIYRFFNIYSYLQTWEIFDQLNVSFKDFFKNKFCTFWSLSYPKL